MAELVDALASGASELTFVEVQVLSRAPVLFAGRVARIYFISLIMIK